MKFMSRKKDPPEKKTLIHGHLYPPVARMIRFKKTFDGIFSHYDNTEINLGTQ